MKKTLLFVFALLFATASMAQNRAVLLQESFDGSSLPSGWSIEGQQSNWSVSATQNAGGQANEMKLDWSPQFNGTTRLVTPAFDLTGISSLVFSFKHALDNYQGSNAIGVATSSDGSTWNQAWSQSYSSSNAWQVTVDVNTPDMGQPNVKFCIFFNGNSYNINDWYFDDITVFTVENLDLGIEAVTVPDFVGSGATQIGMKVFNYGATPVTSLRASYEVDGMETVTEDFTVNIASLATATVTFETPAQLIPGSYNMILRIEQVNGTNDDVADNNVAAHSVSVAIASAGRFPMIEHFSSSTCGPCVSVNTAMLSFCNNNAGRFTYTKYQMNWPGNGDPYYTEEGGVRRDFYGVNAVPQCFLDGEDQGYAAVTQNVFDQHAVNPAFMDIRGFFTVDGNTVNVDIDIMPYVDATARIYATVNEKETHNNVGSNGETSFHHIFMKMLTSPTGDETNFTATELQHLSFSQNMTGTHVEEMDDLEVSIWVQDYASHEVLNSSFAYENIGYLPPVGNLTLAEDESGEENIMVASWEDPGVYTPHTFNVYLNGELVETNYSETSYSFPAEQGAYYVVAVQVMYENDMTSVKSVVGKMDTWKVDESEIVSKCSIYPNPTNGNFTVAGNDIAKVEVYNLLGQMVFVQQGEKMVNINAGNWNKGIYLVNVTSQNGTVETTKLIVK